jgi:predicted permease
MENLALIIVCFLAGMLSRKIGILPPATPDVLGKFIINLSLPSLAFLFLHEMQFSANLIYPVLMPWIAFIVAAGFFYAAGKLLKLPDKTVGCLMLTAGLGNTSFVGLPMITAYYGAEYVGIGVLCDQPGSFLVLSTLGIMTATLYSSGKASWGGILKKVVTFPPFQAVILGVLLRGVPLPDWSIGMLKGMGATITPLAMVAVGYQLKFARTQRLLTKLSTGLIFKLILIPAFIYLIYIVVLGLSGVEMRVTIFEAAMGPMVTGGIIAMQYDLDGELATMMTGIGIPLSFITLPVWYYLLSGV